MIRKILAIWAGGIVTLFFAFGTDFFFSELLSLQAKLLLGALLGVLVFWSVLKWNVFKVFEK